MIDIFRVDEVSHINSFYFQILDAISSSAAVLSSSLQEEGMSLDKIDDVFEKSIEVSLNHQFIHYSFIPSSIHTNLLSQKSVRKSLQFFRISHSLD